jgi:hypothetical protein
MAQKISVLGIDIALRMREQFPVIVERGMEVLELLSQSLIPHHDRSSDHAKGSHSPMPEWMTLSPSGSESASGVSLARIIVHEQSSLHWRFEGSWDITADPGYRGFSRQAQEALSYCSGDDPRPSNPRVAMDRHMPARLGVLDNGVDEVF